jgi:hypothetical protein
MELMPPTLDVLMLESHPHAGAEAVASLEADGHRVHRCHDDPEQPFPCRGLTTGDSCPLVGHIDVAVVVQRGRGTSPTDLQSGVRCAIRAGVPVIESGTGHFAPFGPWLTTRVPLGGDVVAACTDVAEHRFDGLQALIMDRIARLVAAAAMDPATVECSFEESPMALDVHLTLPSAASRGLEQALAVRVLDAVRTDPTTYGRVDVHVHTGEAHV